MTLFSCFLQTTKKQFHCHDCGICRVGGGEIFFHCPKCGSCYSVNIRDNNECIENSMKNYCPICYEFLFDSVRQTNIMKCGHSMHMDCFSEMILQNQFRCPLCSKSVVDMSDVWRRFDGRLKLQPCQKNTTMMCLFFVMTATKRAKQGSTYLATNASIVVRIIHAI